MSRIRLYFDEDAMQLGLVAALRARHVDVVMASDDAMINRSDEVHLRHATRAGRVLYSFNIGDYAFLHEQWLAHRESHFGIVLARQQHYSIGEQLRRLLSLVNSKSAAEMTSHLEYLSAWGR